MTSQITRYGKYVELSPIKNARTKNPLARLHSLSLEEVKVFKASKEQGTIVFAINKIVVKWNLLKAGPNELKMHSDDFSRYPFMLPVLYGKNKSTFTLPLLFGRVFNFSSIDEANADKFFFDSLRKRINKEAGSKLVNSNFELSGEELQSVMMLPLCDGNLIPLIEQLKYRGLEQQINAINDYVKAMADILFRDNLIHGDLRPRNIYYTINKENVLTLFLADPGKAKRNPAGKKQAHEFGPFLSSVNSLLKARKPDNLGKESLSWSELHLGPNTELMREVPPSPSTPSVISIRPRIVRQATLSSPQSLFDDRSEVRTKQNSQSKRQKLKFALSTPNYVSPLSQITVDAGLYPEPVALPQDM